MNKYVLLDSIPIFNSLTEVLTHNIDTHLHDVCICLLIKHKLLLIVVLIQLVAYVTVNW